MTSEEHRRIEQLFEEGKSRPLWPDGVIERRAEWLNPRQFQTLREEFPVLYVPFGTIEWHERHLPLGTDGLKAHGICVRVAGRIGGIVHPSIFWGIDSWRKVASGNIRRGMDATVDLPLPGSVYQLNDQTFRSLVEDIVTEAVRSDFELVVLLAGHNAKNQETTLKELAEKLNEAAETPRVLATNDWENAREQFDWAGDHAGKWETNILMAMHPEKVDMDELPRRPAKLTASGGIDPRGESSEKQGKQCLDVVVDVLCERISRMLKEIQRKQ